MTARTRCGWVKFTECGMYGRRFYLRLKVAVYMIMKGRQYCMEVKRDGNFTMDRKIHGESNVWNIAQGQKNIYRFDVHAGFEGNYGSVGYGKQCSLVWSCVEDRG